MPKLDFKGINEKLLADIETYLNEWLPGGNIEGRNYVVKNPTRDDATPGSFKVELNTGIWKDWATTEKGGDLINLYAYLNGLTDGEAGKKLASSYSLDKIAKNPKVRIGNTTAEDGYKLVMPVPGNAPECPKAINIKGLGSVAPSRIYEYKDADKNTLCYIYRFDPEEYPKLQRKEINPMSLWEDKTGRLVWRQKAPPDNRPLYNLDMLAAYTIPPAIVVSGEKCVDAIKYHFGKKYPAEAFWPFVPTTWPFGDNGIAKADFRPLLNREIIYWPDNDESGKKAMSFLNSKYPGIILNIKHDVKGWDVADLITENLENEEFDLASYIREAVHEENEAKPSFNELAPKSIFSFVRQNGNVPYSIENVEAIMKYYKMKIYYNVISKELEFTVNGKPYDNIDAKNNFITRVKSLCSINSMLRGDVKAALSYVASENPINPVLDWICSNKRLV